MKHETQPYTPNTEPSIESGVNYDAESAKAGWDSPERARELVGELIHEGSKVLDVGIGTGQAVEGYAEKGATVIGIDNSEEMFKTAQEVTGNSGIMRLSDINEQLPVGDLEEQIDVAQAIGALEFAEDIESVFEQVVPTLKKGGAFVFTVETLDQDDPASKNSEYFPGAGATVYRHSQEEVHDLLADKGLTLLYEETYDGYDRGDTNEGKVPYQIFLACK